ncbi:MAG: hypothetical protein IT371_30085, partial [Deltaproteobacteria bacterium]|nr:hypothetical protein [Deltaproteobacteria bacterium]
MRHGSFATLLLLSLTACPGSNPALDPALNAGGEDPYAACTDPEKCCPEAQRTCVGSPDTGLVCSCQSLWDCSKNPSKCESEIPTPPPGGGAWRCTWSEQKYTCAQSGEANTPPPSGGGWSCSFDSKSGAWICTMTYVPTPTNQPGGTGGWRCSVVEELKKLVCKKIETATPGQGPDAGTGSTPTPPPTSPPRRDGGFKWPLPTRPDAGTTTPPPTSPGTECIPGQKMWCDGEQYCGWGMVECLADGKWKSKLVNGRRVIDCQERSDGKRPNTPCACYNVYFEPKCCEQANCILPAGTD